MLVQPEAAEQRDDDVSEGRGWHDEGEISPAEGCHVTGEEADEQDDAGDGVHVEESAEEQAEVVEIDRAYLRHAVRKQRVTHRCGEHDGDEDGVLGWLEGGLHLDSCCLASTACRI